LKDINLIKCDVEGAELKFLIGATDIFSQKIPPMWIFEINMQTSKAFGYNPSEILKLLRSYDEYQFYKINHAWGKVIPMKKITDYRHGDNVLCIVPKYHNHRLKNIWLK
jgi:hypothetical protein